MIVSVIYQILIYFLIQCDQVHDEACLLFETCFLKYFHIHQSPPATSPTMGMGWAPLAAIPQVFFLLILVTMSALRMMMMMSAMMTLEICRKQRHRPHAECLLVCNCVEIVPVAAFQVQRIRVSNGSCTVQISYSIKFVLT